MRAISCVFVLVACVAAPSYAQTLQTPRAVYTEFGGSLMYYSVNGEVPVGPNRTVRVGGMVLPGFATGATASVNQLIRYGNDYVIFGVGMTRLGGHNSHFTAGTATVGYRHTRPGGSFVQFAVTPLITSRGVHPYAGLSIGKSF